jgi:hypothetical protein
MFENGALRRPKIKGAIKLHDEELHKLYHFPNIFGMIKSGACDRRGM